MFLRLTQAINTAQSLNLFHESGILALSICEEHECRLKVLVWILSSVSGLLSLKYGRVSVSPTSYLTTHITGSDTRQALTHEHIDYPPPTVTGLAPVKISGQRKSAAYFDAFCELGHISSLIAYHIYSQNNLSIGRFVLKAQALLENWQENLPDVLKNEPDLQIWYHEAAFTLHQHIIGSMTSPNTVTNPEFHASRSAVLKSARQVLAMNWLGTNAPHTR
jgi:hypothetical protein